MIYLGFILVLILFLLIMTCPSRRHFEDYIYGLLKEGVGDVLRPNSVCNMLFGSRLAKMGKKALNIHYENHILFATADITTANGKMYFIGGLRGWSRCE